MYTFYGNGIVWDASINKKLCKFEKESFTVGEKGENLGIFKTEDENIARKLIAMGYKYDKEPVKYNKEIEDNISITLDGEEIAKNIMPSFPEEIEEDVPDFNLEDLRNFKFEDLEYKELKKLAKEKEIKGYTTMSKKKLIEALREW